jgi:membrane fusion protein (multidrug efflux system)
MASKVIYSVVAVVGIAAASGGAWWYQSKPKGPQEIFAVGNAAPGGVAVAPVAAASAARAAGVEVAKVERTTLQDDAQSVGSLRSRQSVMLRPEVAGRVKSLGFVDGATVRQGQVLVQLDDTLQKAEIKQAKAQVSIAQANFKRNQDLVAQSFVAQRVLEESSANLQVAEAQLALACARLSRMAITAPFDATVGIRNVNLGDFVKDGADLINLEDLRSMYVDFRLPERYQTKLRPRQVVELQLDSLPGRVFRATVEAIDPLLDVNGRSIGVRAVLPNTLGEPLQAGGKRAAAPAASAPVASAPSARKSAVVARPATPPGALAVERVIVDNDGCVTEGVPAAAKAGIGALARPAGTVAPLRPGMFARVTTVFAVRDLAIVVPEEAIVPQGGRQFVIKVVDSAMVASRAGASAPADTGLVSMRQEVKLGARQSGKVEVTEGLVEGETVVIAGQQRLQRDGTLLRVVDLGRSGQAAGAPAAAKAGASAPLPGSAAAASP